MRLSITPARMTPQVAVALGADVPQLVHNRCQLFPPAASPENAVGKNSAGRASRAHVVSRIGCIAHSRPRLRSVSRPSANRSGVKGWPECRAKPPCEPGKTAWPRETSPYATTRRARRPCPRPRRRICQVKSKPGRPRPADRTRTADACDVRRQRFHSIPPGHVTTVCRPVFHRPCPSGQSPARAAEYLPGRSSLPAGSASNVGLLGTSVTRSRTPTNSRMARVPASPRRGLANRSMRV